VASGIPRSQPRSWRNQWIIYSALIHLPVHDQLRGGSGVHPGVGEAVPKPLVAGVEVEDVVFNGFSLSSKRTPSISQTPFCCRERNRGDVLGRNAVGFNHLEVELDWVVGKAAFIGIGD
jgi:hypothetical protein